MAGPSVAMNQESREIQSPVKQTAHDLKRNDKPNKYNSRHTLVGLLARCLPQKLGSDRDDQVVALRLQAANDQRLERVYKSGPLQAVEIDVNYLW